MKNRHPKRKLALKMLHPLEKKNKVPPFQSAAWNKRVEARKKKVAKKSKKK